MLYEHVESLSAARDYQRYATDLQYEPFHDEEMEEMETAVTDLCGRFGPLFKKPNGWALPPFHFAPNFRQIEEATDLNHYRPYYRMASHPVHAGPKGIAFDIGLRKQGQVMLAGPSNGGLSDPGHGMCISLSQLTSSFILSRNPDAGSVVTLRIILSLSDLAGEAFIRTYRELEKEEREREDAEPSTTPEPAR